MLELVGIRSSVYWPSSLVSSVRLGMVHVIPWPKGMICSPVSRLRPPLRQADVGQAQPANRFVEHDRELVNRRVAQAGDTAGMLTVGLVKSTVNWRT